MKKLIIWLIFLSLVSCSFAVTPSFQGLGDLPGGSFFSVATDVSGDGTTIVGYSNSASGSSQVFRWTLTGGMVGLDGFVGSYPMGSPPKISRDGSAIAGSTTNEAVLWTAEYALEHLGGSNSKGTGVSADGSVVVGYNTTPFGQEQAFKWTRESGMTEIQSSSGYNIFSSQAFAVSDNGSVVAGMAYYSDTYDGEAARWTQDGVSHIVDTSGNISTQSVTDVSADGSIFVGYGVGFGSGSWEAFRWTEEGGIVSLGGLGSINSNQYAWGISGDGKTIVGECGVYNGREAFVWDEINGMRSIKDILVNNYNLNLSGWSLTMATAINYDGTTIVGVGNNPDGNLEAWIATIPEPTSLVLLGLGGILIRKR